MFLKNYGIDILLDYSVIGATAMVKVPQILAPLKKQKKVIGLYAGGCLLEFLGYLFLFRYNWTHKYALRTYFEFVFIIIQNFVIIRFFLQMAGKLDIIGFVMPLGVVCLVHILYYGEEFITAYIRGVPIPWIPSKPWFIELGSSFSTDNELLRILCDNSLIRNEDNASLLNLIILCYASFARHITNYFVKRDKVLTSQSSMLLTLRGLIILFILIRKWEDKAKENLNTS